MPKKLTRREQRFIRKNYEHDRILSAHQPEGVFPFVLILDHLKAGYNVGKILRIANIFGVREVHLVGVPPFDPSPSCGGFRHTKTKTFTQVTESYEALKKENYQFFAFDLCPDSQPFNQITFPQKSAFILGHERFGLSFDPKNFPDLTVVKIPQFGVVQSLNVSIVAGIACYEYLRQNKFKAWASDCPDLKTENSLQSQWLNHTQHPRV